MEETAGKILDCFQEIRLAANLIDSLPENKGALQDDIEYERRLQLRLQCNDNLFDISLEITKKILEAHIAKKKKDLQELNKQVKKELGV